MINSLTEAFFYVFPTIIKTNTFKIILSFSLKINNLTINIYNRILLNMEIISLGLHISAMQ